MARTDTPLTIIWRQVPNLHSCKTLVDGMLSLPLVGEDDDTLMYDGQTIILGFFGQEEFAKVNSARQADFVVADEVGRHNLKRFDVASQCSGLNFSRVDMVVNPAVKLAFATPDLHLPRARLREEGFDTRAATVKEQLGSTIPFYDHAGNLFSLTKFSEQALTTATGFVGPRLSSILGGHATEHPKFAGLTLVVSDVAKSEAFYSDVLGLERLQGLDDVVTFDAGTCLIHLVPESTPRMVSSLRQTGRLHGDWFVFHTRDINALVGRLSRLGAKFPQGIEESATGQMAYFNDPDGFALVVWQPPEDETLPMKKIKFFPVLNRILKTATANAAAA